MRKVQREYLVDYASYETQRAMHRIQVNEEKETRRLEIERRFVVCFETTLTVAHQIQETIYLERLTRESDIQHELDTFNAVLAEDRAQ